MKKLILTRILKSSSLDTKFEKYYLSTADNLCWVLQVRKENGRISYRKGRDRKMELLATDDDFFGGSQRLFLFSRDPKMDVWCNSLPQEFFERHNI